MATVISPAVPDIILDFPFSLGTLPFMFRPTLQRKVLQAQGPNSKGQFERLTPVVVHDHCAGYSFHYHDCFVIGHFFPSLQSQTHHSCLGLLVRLCEQHTSRRGSMEPRAA